VRHRFAQVAGPQRQLRSSPFLHTPIIDVKIKLVARLADTHVG